MQTGSGAAHRQHLYHYVGEVRSRLPADRPHRLGDLIDHMRRAGEVPLSITRRHVENRRTLTLKQVRHWAIPAVLLALVAVLFTGQHEPFRYGAGLGLLASAAALMALRAWDMAAGQAVLLQQLDLWDEALACTEPTAPWPTPTSPRPRSK